MIPKVNFSNSAERCGLILKIEFVVFIDQFIAVVGSVEQLNDQPNLLGVVFGKRLLLGHYFVSILFICLFVRLKNDHMTTSLNGSFC